MSLEILAPQITITTLFPVNLAARFLKEATATAAAPSIILWCLFIIQTMFSAISSSLKNSGLSQVVVVLYKREFFEETTYRCSELHWLASFEDKIEGWPNYQLTIFWGIYDGQQSFLCQEGQDLKFVLRQKAERYQVPKNIIRFWDLALDAANLCLKPSNPTD